MWFRPRQYIDHAADSGRHCKPHLNHRGEFVYLDRDRGQCHSGGHYRNGWQHLYRAAERRNPGGKPHCDDYLYCRRDWKWRNSFRDRICNGSGACRTDSHHHRQSCFDHRGEFVYFDCDRGKCNPSRGDR